MKVYINKWVEVKKIKTALGVIDQDEQSLTLHNPYFEVTVKEAGNKKFVVEIMNASRKIVIVGLPQNPEVVGIDVKLDREIEKVLKKVRQGEVEVEDAVLEMKEVVIAGWLRRKMEELMWHQGGGDKR